MPVETHPTSPSNKSRSFTDFEALKSENLYHEGKEDAVVTSSIRRTILHLRSRYGYLSRFRGFACWLCTGWLQVAVAGGFAALLPLGRFSLKFAVSSMISDLLVARLIATWVHIVITEPTGQRWWRRLPSPKAWLQLLPATALFTVVNHAVSALLMSVILFAGRYDLSDTLAGYSLPIQTIFTALIRLLPILLAIFAATLICIPSSVILIRVAASMLPSNTTTVVSFDRSFGGYLQDSDDKLSLSAAWASFNRAARIRLVKLVTKWVGVLLASYALFLLVVLGEVFLAAECDAFVNML